MTKNLKTADLIAKIVLSISVILFYFLNAISGPLADVLLVLAILVLVIFIAKLIITKRVH